VSDRSAVLPQYLFPKQALTNFAGWVAGKERGAVTTWIIRRFVAKYGVNMGEALESDIEYYKSFNQFFTRALKPGARPLAQADLVCPVDGAISQFGPIEGDQIFQAKGHNYTTTALVGGDAALAAKFAHGSFATLYLSPKDYHRIHMPCDGRLVRMIHVPGDLFSVNPTTARGVPGLFARNERVVCVFESARGPSCWCWWAPPSWAAWPRCGTAWSTRRAWANCASGATTTSRSTSARATRWAVSCSAPPSSCCSPSRPWRSTPTGRQAARSAWAKRWRATPASDVYL
jgi:phosphatidylserine decarboxylase